MYCVMGEAEFELATLLLPLIQSLAAAAETVSLHQRLTLRPDANATVLTTADCALQEAAVANDATILFFF